MPLLFITASSTRDSAGLWEFLEQLSNFDVAMNDVVIKAGILAGMMDNPGSSLRATHWFFLPALFCRHVRLFGDSGFKAVKWLGRHAGLRGFALFARGSCVCMGTTSCLG